MNLKQQRAAALKAAQDIVAKAKAENRDLTDDEQSEIEAKTAEIADLDKKIKGAALVDSIASLDSADTDPDEPTAAKSIGDHFVKSVAGQLSTARSEKSRFSVSAPEFKASTDPQLSPAALAPATTTIDTNIVQGFRRRMTIADLLGSGSLAGSALTYFVEGALEGDFTTVAEGAAKPQLHYADPTPVTETLKKIAGFLKESDEMVEDLPFLVSAINNRLLYNLALFEENQILAGDGTGTNLKGLLNRSGIQSLGATGNPAAANADWVFKAMTAIQTAIGLDADGVVINPADYQTFRLNKDGNGQYYGGGYFGPAYGEFPGQFAQQPPLWGLKTVVTPAIAAGTVLVGNFAQSSTLYRKGGVRVEMTNTDQDDFVKNKVTIRAEERVALAVRVPAALVKLTLGTA